MLPACPRFTSSIHPGAGVLARFGESDAGGSRTAWKDCPPFGCRRIRGFRVDKRGPVFNLK